MTIDDGYETERTLANTKALIQDKQKVFALLGYYGSSPTTEAMNNAFGRPSAAGRHHFRRRQPAPGAVHQPPNNRCMFNLRASYADETEAIVNQMAALGLSEHRRLLPERRLRQIGSGRRHRRDEKNNLNPVAVGTVERNSVDVAKAVEAIAKANPQAVVMVTLLKPTAAFVKGMKAAGFPMFMTLSPVGAELLAQELGNDSRGIGISQVVPYPGTTPSASSATTRKYSASRRTSIPTTAWRLLHHRPRRQRGPEEGRARSHPGKTHHRRPGGHEQPGCRWLPRLLRPGFLGCAYVELTVGRHRRQRFWK